jgi:hypothetical protein
MIPVEIGIIKGGGMGEISGGGIQVWHIWCIVRSLINATMYPHPTQQ